MTDIIQVVRQFTEAVGCTTDRYNVRQTALYIGLQLEEMAEILEALPLPPDYLRMGIQHFHQLSKDFKAGGYDDLVQYARRDALLDGCIDLAWVTIGSALSQGADVEGAAGEVVRANLAKLVKCDKCSGSGGTAFEGDACVCGYCDGIGLIAIKDANGKVKKPDGWVSPNIKPFVCKESANG